MSWYGSLAQFLGEESFEEYRAAFIRQFEGYLDVRREDDTLVFCTTEKGVWWMHGLTWRLTWPTRFEGVMAHCDAWLEMARGRVPDAMGAWREPHGAADEALLARWQQQARDRRQHV